MTAPTITRSRPLGQWQSRWTNHLVPVLIYLLVYYILTFPALHLFTTEFLSDDGDGPQNIWNIWWIKKAVYEWRSPWHTDYLFHPEGITLVGAVTLAGLGGDVSTAAKVVGVLAVAFATFNVVGGFLVTHRMLAMFRRK